MPKHPRKFNVNKLGEGSLSPPSSVSSVNDEEISNYLHLYSQSSHGEMEYGRDKQGPRTSKHYAESLKVSRAASTFKLITEKRPKSTARSMRRLPTLDTYEKNLEFQAQAPTRVLLRLERLMGTEKVSMTDPRYMKTLHSRLAQDEHDAWIKRSKVRMKAEEDRFRRLAIAGLADPASDKDITDLYFHPVFRVNRVLDRLAKIDRDILHAAETPKRPIKLVEPFANYERTGILFPAHKNHYLKSPSSTTSLNTNNTISYTSFNDSINELSVIPSRRFHIPHFTKSGSITPVSSLSSGDSPYMIDTPQPLDLPEVLKVPLSISSMVQLAKVPSSMTISGSNTQVNYKAKDLPTATSEALSMLRIFTSSSKYTGMNLGKEPLPRIQITEDEEKEMKETEKVYKENCDDDELNEIKAQYGIDVQEDLNTMWNRHRSPLLKLVKEKNGVNELFEVSGKVLDTYKRKQLKTEDFCKKHKHFFISDK